MVTKDFIKDNFHLLNIYFGSSTETAMGASIDAQNRADSDYVRAVNG